MRTYLFIPFLALCAARASAQTIPNGDFEEWNIVEYGIPEGWNTSAREDLFDVGFSSSGEAPGQVNSCIHLETLAAGDTLISGYFSNTESDPLAGEGGVPYGGIPTAITGYYRYHLPELDTALLVVICKYEGSMTSFDLFKIKGSGEQSTFAAFNFALSNSSLVDTVIIAGACSNLLSEENIEIGSWIEWDELAFTGAAPGLPPIPNGSFDNWTDYSWDRPVNWNVRGMDISRVTDSYSNTYALKLVNRTYDDGTLQPASVSTAELGDGPPHGGLPYSHLQDTLCGYYKFLAPGGQLAAVSAMIFSNGDNVGGNYLTLLPANEYTYFELPLMAFTTPDTLGVEISSAAWPWESALEGNALIVDKVQLKSAPLGVQSRTKRNVSLFPNPAREVIYLSLPDGVRSDEWLHVHDQGGRMVCSTRVTQARTGIDTTTLPQGLYTCRLGSDAHSWSGQFIVVK